MGLKIRALSCCVIFLALTPSWTLGNNKAGEFFIAFPKSTFEHEQLSIFITTPGNHSVLVLLDSLKTFRKIVLIKPTTTYVIRPPASFEILRSSDHDKGIRIYTLIPSHIISVSVMKYALVNTLSSVYLALPPITYPGLEKYEYYISSYQWNNRVLTNFTSVIELVGTQANTSVIITPSQEIEIPQFFKNPSYNWSIVEAGESYVFFLGIMQTFHIENFYDLTGTKITSDKPLTVIGAHECADVPIGVEFCDSIVEQFPPTITWGRFFLLTSLHSRLTGERYRIITMKTSTTVKIKCVSDYNPEFGHVILVLNDTGRYREFELGRDRFCSITANKPFLLIQYSQGYSIDGVGDPFMAIIPPVEQYSNNFTAVAPAAFNNHLTITVPLEYFNNNHTILLNDTILLTEWIPIYCSKTFVCGYGTRLSVEEGTHRISHVHSQAKFLVMAYGFEYHDGYGSHTGMELNWIADVCQHGEVRLTSASAGEKHKYVAGHVDVCLDGVWSRVCGNSWTSREAVVVCRQLFGRDNVMGAVGYSVASSNLSWSHLIGDVHCVGSESALLECDWNMDHMDDDDLAASRLAMGICYQKMNITVEFSPSSLLPHFAHNPATLVCIATCTPTMMQELYIHFTWSRHGSQVPINSYTYATQAQQSGKTSSTQQSQFESILNIFTLAMEDAGLYTCSVIVVHNATRQPLAQPSENSFNLTVLETESVIFQLRLIGVGHCGNWLHQSPVLEKTAQVEQNVVQQISSSCPSCSPTQSHVSDSIFMCFRTESNQVTFRSKLYTTSSTSLSTIVTILEDWVRRSPFLSVAGLMVSVDPSCMVVISSFIVPECVWPSVTSNPTNTITTQDAKGGDDNNHLCDSRFPGNAETPLPLVVGCVTLIVVVMIIAITTILVVTSYLRYRNKNPISVTSPLPVASFDDPMGEASFDDPVGDKLQTDVDHYKVQAFPQVLGPFNLPAPVKKQ